MLIKPEANSAQVKNASQLQKKNRHLKISNAAAHENEWMDVVK